MDRIRPSPEHERERARIDEALSEKAKLWFAEARAQTRRDDEDVANWRLRHGGGTGSGDGGSSSFDSNGGGDCGGD